MGLTTVQRDCAACDQENVDENTYLPTTNYYQTEGFTSAAYLH